MKEVTSAKAIAAAANKSYVVRAVSNIHGESDHYAYTTGDEEFPLDGSDGTPKKVATYADALLEWQSDYETGIKAITNQSQPVPMFVSQVSGWTDAPTSKVAQYELEAHVRAPGKVILIGASYQLPLNTTDCRHFTAEGVRRLGEYFAKVYGRVVFEGKTWEPVRPKTITRDGAVITVAYHVPVPPLAFDTVKVAEIASYGYTFADAGGNAVAITNVVLAGQDTVKITLAAAPAANGHLKYAQNQPASSCVGTPTGARGNLRDSDATPSKNGYALENWGVMFDLAVP